MKKLILALALCASLVAGCTDQPHAATVVTTAPVAPVVVARPVAPVVVVRPARVYPRRVVVVRPRAAVRVYHARPVRVYHHY